MSDFNQAYLVNGTDLFSGIAGPGQPVGAIGYNVNGTNLFTYYTNQGANYQSNLSKFNPLKTSGSGISSKSEIIIISSLFTLIEFKTFKI